MKKVFIPLSIMAVLVISSCSFFNVVPSDSTKPSFIDSEDTSTISEGTSTTSNTSEDTSNTGKDTSETSITSEESVTSETSITSEETTTSTTSEEEEAYYADIPVTRTDINHGSENKDYGDSSNSIDIKNTFLYWRDQNWSGSFVQIGDHFAENKVLNFSYVIQFGNCNYGFQVFYKNSELVTGTRYTITFDLYSLKGGSIGLNHTDISINAGDNKVSLAYDENANQSSFALVFPTSLGDNTIRISNISWTLYKDSGGDDTPTSEVTYPDGYTNLVFQDEFNGTSLDLTKWSYEIGNGDWGWGNGELEYYTNNNDTVKDGLLTIEARKEDKGNQHYTSSRIITKNKAKFTYGYIEARIALPEGNAMWPAFWMMPNDSSYGTWPRSGEIDIMEARGRLPYISSSALHYTIKSSNDHTYSTSEYSHSTKITHFHTYACKWTSNSITFYVDGNINYVAYKNTWQTYADLTNDVAPFDKDFYIILNLAVGGQFDNFITPDDSSLPKQMKVDYVRWFQ